MIFVLAGMAVLLTMTMFITRQMMLGFPCAIFFAILGGYCYQQSSTIWDIYYLLFFASMGMTIFCMIAMYALRAKDLSGPDADEEKFFDEEREPDLRGDIEKNKEYGKGGRYVDEPKPSRRIQGLRDRADRRRSK